MLGWLFRGRDRETFPYRPKAIRDPEVTEYRSRHSPYARKGVRPMIVDDDGWVYSEWEYVEPGIREGWLVYCGFHFDGPICIEHYRIITPE